MANGDDMPAFPPSPRKDLPEPFGPSTRVITKAQAPEARRRRLALAASNRQSALENARASEAPADRPATRAEAFVRNLKSGRDLLRGGR